MEQKEVREPAQVHVDGTPLPHAVRGVDVASERGSAHDVADRAETSGLVAQTQVDGIAEFAPGVSGYRFGLVSGGEVLASSESVDHVGGVEFLAVETQPEEQGVLVVQCGVVLRSDFGAQGGPAVIVTSGEVCARLDGAQIAGVSGPGVEVPDLDEQRGVLLDHVAFVLDVVVGESDFVVGRFEELLPESDVEQRAVKVASGIELCGIEAPQYVRDLVFDHVSAVGEVPAVEVGEEFEAVSGSEDVGVGECDHGTAFGADGSVGGDGPAVAGRDDEVHARGVDRIGLYGDVDFGNVAPGADELFGADDELRIELVSGFEEQVAADDAVAGEHVCVVCGAFEPAASGVEDLLSFDGDLPDGFAGEGFQQAAFVAELSVRGSIEDGFDEHQVVEHARDGASACFRLNAVVESVVSVSGFRVPDPGAVGGEAVGGLHAGSCRGACGAGCGHTTRETQDQDQDECAEPEHGLKDNVKIR